MGLRSALSAAFSGSKTTDSTSSSSRGTRDRDRRNKEIRRIDADTDTWLRNGGIGPRKDH